MKWIVTQSHYGEEDCPVAVASSRDEALWLTEKIREEDDEANYHFWHLQEDGTYKLVNTL